MATSKILGMNPLLQYVSDLLSFFQAKTIPTPSTYRDQVLTVKKSLKEDVSGMVNTVLDFAIECAWVNYRVDSSNKNLEDQLNRWLSNINEGYRGKIPTGLEALAKEYFRERWKGSSQMLLRTFWEKDKKSGLELPSVMFFVDGEDILCQGPKDSAAVVLGEEEYSLRVSSSTDENIKLPVNSANEVIFVQKPYESWGTYEPTPWLIRKGIWRNLQMMKLLNDKGEFILGRALEYLLLIKKGSERLALDGNVTYSAADLQKVSDDLTAIVEEKKTEEGAPTYTTQFDTSFEHLIPEYKRIMDEGLYAPIEKKILAGLGLVDIVQGVSSTRREAVLNPRPFIGEVKQGIKDFKALLVDVIKEIIERNDTSHKKWMNETIEISSMPVSDFMDNDARQVLRSLYDRGLLSKRTSVEVLGEMDYDIEKQRRELENSEDTETMYPPVVQNIEGTTNEYDEVDVAEPEEEETNVKEETNPSDKTGPEAKNYTNSKVLEEAPYKKITDLPETLNVLPKSAKELWMRVFNESFPKGEDYARKVAWTVVKQSYKKVGDKWKKKTSGKLETASASIDTQLKLKKLEILSNQNELVTKLIGEHK